MDQLTGRARMTLSKEKSRESILVWRKKAATLLTLRVHRSALVGRVRVVGRVGHLCIVLIDHSTARRTTVLAGDLAIRGLVSDRRELRADSTGVSRWLAVGWVRRIGRFDLVGLGSLSGSTLTLLNSLTLSLFLLLASLPFLADFLEFLRSTFRAVRLHSHVCIQMV